ncbi:putative beta-amylase [Medicago truncatula]|uniref:Beta-amylase n=3 Tax=Trifolieae TaxID=163742 RepID=G7ISJ8_MEDTR|nr:inactive beta-amylase 9 [Medicago truncatula]AES64255.1 beta-amylase [Medicago truncatula]RHN72325.1 putative beta-amylase [Medicago truncatula]
MEISVIGNSQVKFGRTDFACRELGYVILKNNCRFSKGGVCFGQNLRLKKGGGIGLKAIHAEPVREMKNKPSGSRTRSKQADGVRLFVGLPLDTVSHDCNSINHSKAIAAGLKALKLLGVEGVELPIWWGIVEKEAMGKYDWSGYLAIAEMIQKVGLKLHVSLCFHGSKKPNIPLPKWISEIGESQPSIFFTDRSGQVYKECLSLAVDNLPVLNGKTPVQVYQSFCESFKSKFSPFMKSTITGISMGLGPDGKLRYPSHHELPSNGKTQGVGEFQCYDQNMLSLLKQQAESSGNPLWGLGGPHDVPTYDQSPYSNSFFKDGGSWESSYGDFFLSWYSSQLIAHGDSLLSLASSTFGDTGISIYGKIPLMHSWYGTRSHPSELTAGFYNTANLDGYEQVAQMFAKNSCKIILPGMDLSDANQPNETHSSPELLLSQTMTTFRNHGVSISGQNSSELGVPGGFEQMKKNLSGDNVLDLFSYQRMGAYFFSPEHFPSFTELVRSLNQPKLHLDDLPTEEEEGAESAVMSQESSVSMQAA